MHKGVFFTQFVCLFYKMEMTGIWDAPAPALAPDLTKCPSWVVLYKGAIPLKYFAPCVAGAGCEKIHLKYH